MVENLCLLLKYMCEQQETNKQSFCWRMREIFNHLTNPTFEKKSNNNFIPIKSLASLTFVVYDVDDDDDGDDKWSSSSSSLSSPLF